MDKFTQSNEPNENTMINRFSKVVTIMVMYVHSKTKRKKNAHYIIM